MHVPQVPSLDGLQRISSLGAATAGSRASVDMVGNTDPQPFVADKESQARGEALVVQ